MRTVPPRVFFDSRLWRTLGGRFRHLGWDYNENHPHFTLKDPSPREYARRAMPKAADSPFVAAQRTRFPATVANLKSQRTEKPERALHLSPLITVFLVLPKGRPVIGRGTSAAGRQQRSVSILRCFGNRRG